MATQQEETIVRETHFVGGQVEKHEELNSQGKRHGLYELYYDNGQIGCRQQYNNGTLHGTVEYYYPNGRLEFRKQYRNGVEDGLFEEYDEDGNLMHMTIYENGKVTDELEL